MKTHSPWILLLAAVLQMRAADVIEGESFYVRKGTWRESLVAGREKLFRHEMQTDNAEFAKTGIAFGDWYCAKTGADYRKLPQDIQDAKVAIDVTKPLEIDGKTYPWTKVSGFRPDVLHDIAKLIDIDKNSYALMVSTLTIPEDQPKGDVPTICFYAARSWILAKDGRHTRAPRGGERCVMLNASFGSLPQKKGTYPVVMLVDLARNAHPHIWYHLKVESQKLGTHRNQMQERRRKLFDKVASEFQDPASKLEMRVEASAGVWAVLGDWMPGKPDLITYQYQSRSRYRELERELANMDPAVRQSIEPLVKTLAATKDDALEVAAGKYTLASMLLELKGSAGSFKSMRLAVEDQAKTFRNRYPNAEKYLAEVDGLEKEFNKWLTNDLSLERNAVSSYAALRSKLQAAQRRILLDNPLLKFEKLLVASGSIRLASNWTGACTMGKQLQVLSPVAPDGTLTTIYSGGVSSYELDWDAQKILFSDGSKILEMDVDGQNLRTIKGPDKEIDSSRRYNPCRMPNGDIMFVSTACEHAVPCTGGGGVGNMHVMDKDGENERRITYDQDHNWDPCVLNNGRVVYTRWEYTDLPHYFSRLLMSMNPDGTDQKEYYGSASYWPNAQYWTRPIPGHPTRIVTIVSGHHGVSRMGEMHILDPALGTHEADGFFQQIPGYGKMVEPIIRDNLVGSSWRKLITPCPLGTNPQEDGAGTYFLATVKMQDKAPWQLCLVDIFDNITPILEGDYAMPVPVLARSKPPVVPTTVDVAKKTGTALVTDIYKGPGVAGFPKGSVKKLRVGTYHYRYPGNGDTYAASHEGGWDIRRIIGTVPVEEDGSALFEIPANMPIFVQPLDADGQALQVMRSWFTCQPGENLTCIGCHESQNMAPPTTVAMAARKAPVKIKPWNGPMRGFSFEREVQPVLSRKCAGCHDGDGKDRPDFKPGGVYSQESSQKKYRGKSSDKYSAAYMALQKYVRRAGLENDWHTPSPGEYQADTSHVVKMLKKGHHNVRLTRDEWDRLYTWIDFNIPYPANWTESHRHPNEKSVAKREELLRLYSAVNDPIETTALPLPEPAKFEPPSKRKPEAKKLSVAGWPRKGEKGETVTEELDLGDGIKMKLVSIKAGEFVMGDPNGFADERPRRAEIEQPFMMGATEVSLQQYRQFDPNHENKFVSTRRKDQSRRGIFDMDSDPALPVVRISQDQAMAFCEWLSNKTGRKVALPSEEQWEWACRAGSDKTFSFGDYEDGKGKEVMNIADSRIAGWNYGRFEKQFSDRFSYTKPVGVHIPPNVWGLHDMHGNVAEWTASDYIPLKDVGGARGTEQIPYKVVRGGSWNDTARFATSASRWRYPKYQPVYDVGFRVVVQPATRLAGAR